MAKVQCNENSSQREWCLWYCVRGAICCLLLQLGMLAGKWVFSCWLGSTPWVPNNRALLPYLTLPHGEDVLPPSAEASNGPNVHPRINRKVTKSPSAILTCVHTNTWNHPLPRGGLLTWTYLLICTLGISNSKAHKHIHPGHHDQKDSEPKNQGTFSTHTLYIISITL